LRAPVSPARIAIGRPHPVVTALKSDLLRDANDDHGKPMFDPNVRGITDRFVLRFRKKQ
jgi:predicted methyltransferase